MKKNWDKIVFTISFVLLSVTFALFVRDAVPWNSLVYGYSIAYVFLFCLSLIASMIIVRFIGETFLPVQVTKFLRVFLWAISIAAIARTVYLYRNYDQFIDLAYFESMIAQAASWKLPFIWDSITVPVWSQHFHPFLLLIVPLYWMGLGGPLSLVIVQTLSAVLGAIPLYKIARIRGASSYTGYILCAGYLLFGGLQSSYFYGFHEITFFPLLFLWAVYAYERRLPMMYALFLVLSLAVKEEVAFIMLFFGMYLLFRKSYRWGIATIFASIVWSLIAFFAIAWFRGTGYEYWGQFGGGSQSGLAGIFIYAIKNPVLFASQFVNDERKIATIIELFGSFGFLPFLSLSGFMLLIPSLFIKLLSSDIAMLNSFHYSAAITPLFAIAVLEVMVRRKFNAVRLTTYLGMIVLLSNLYYGFLFYYKTYAKLRLDTLSFRDFRVDEKSRSIDGVLATIPVSAGVSCQYQICPHISRPLGYKLPIPHKDILEYVVFDTSLAPVLTTSHDLNAFIKEKVMPSYDLVRKAETIYVFRKKE